MPKIKHAEIDSKTTITCRETGKTVEVAFTKEGLPKLPFGWKRQGDEYVCKEAKAECFCLRSSTLPISSAIVLKSGDEKLPIDWSEERRATGWTQLWKSLRISWRTCAQFCNAAVREIAKGEPAVVLTKKLPEYKPNAKAIDNLLKVYFPSTDLDSQSRGSLLRKAVKKYGDERFNMIRCARSLPSFRDDLPLPICSKDSPLAFDDEGYATIKVRISGTTFLLRMCRDDPSKEGSRGDYSRPLAKWKAVATGEVIRGGITIRAGGREGKDLLVGLEMYLPKDPGPREATEAFVVATDPDALLVGKMYGRTEYVMNEDQLRRWNMIPLKESVEKHASFVQRTSQDRKAERRSHGRADYSGCETPQDRKRVKRRFRQQRENLQRAVERRCEAHDRRIDDAIHKVARIVADHAKRRRVFMVAYDDRCRTYMPKFPYFKLKTRIAEKLAMYGIEFLAEEEVSDNAEPVQPALTGSARKREKKQA